MTRKRHEAIITAMYDSRSVVAHNPIESAYLDTLIRKHESYYEKKYGRPYRHQREIHDGQPFLRLVEASYTTADKP